VAANKAHSAVCAQIVRLLRDERKRQGLSKYAVAERSGLSEQMIGYVEKGMRRPSLETVVRLAAGLNADLAGIVRKAYRNASETK
jgi:transcriptional regulator with XRE-family HTH domain